MIPNAFTVDLEDGLSIAMRDQFGLKIPITDRVEKTGYNILSLLQNTNTKATFFIVGDIAKTYPNLIKDIYACGHEIGAHGNEHFPYWTLSKEKVHYKIKKGKEIIEQLLGIEILGHRAPCFSITTKNIWILDIISELGFKYDSSILPTKKVTYNQQDIGKSITKIKMTNGSELIEVPISTYRLLGIELPFSGGSYLRLLPFFMEKIAFNKNNKERPNILYIHPYEMDTEKYPDFYFEQLNKTSPLKKLKILTNFYNRSKTYSKLETLINNYNFCSIHDILKANSFI